MNVTAEAAAKSFAWFMDMLKEPSFRDFAVNAFRKEPPELQRALIAGAEQILADTRKTCDSLEDFLSRVKPS